MQIKTVITIDGVHEINFSAYDYNATAHFYWFRNLSDSVLYVSAKPNPIIGAEDVAELPANGAVAIETDEGRIYILGAGKVEIHRTDSKICPFRFPSSSSNSGSSEYEMKSYTFSELKIPPSDMQQNTEKFGFINNALYNTSNGYDTCRYNGAELVLQKSLNGYNLTHTYSIDFTKIKKIIIRGVTRSNTNNLTATAFYYIANTITTFLDESTWTKMNESSGVSQSAFTTEIDCNEISGENYLHLAILHGSESTSYTTMLVIGSITFIYE